MGGVFNTVFQIVSTLLGVLMICFGAVWILQGFNIAFLFGPMVGDIQWVFWGIVLAGFGVGQVLWSIRRKA